MRFGNEWNTNLVNTISFIHETVHLSHSYSERSHSTHSLISLAKWSRSGPRIDQLLIRGDSSRIKSLFVFFHSHANAQLISSRVPTRSARIGIRAHAAEYRRSRTQAGQPIRARKNHAMSGLGCFSIALIQCIVAGNCPVEASKSFCFLSRPYRWECF